MKADRYLAWGLEALRKGGWPAITVFGAHVIASRGLHAYVRYPFLDIPMHFLGGIAIAFFFQSAYRAASRHGIVGPFHRTTHDVLVFALTSTATVFWEFAEFLSDRFFGTHAQLGLEDTLGDMLLGIFGGITLLVIVSWRRRGPLASHEEA